MRPWLSGLELRWLLEAQVLGHFGKDAQLRWMANKGLLVTANYAGKWNTEVLALWQGRITASEDFKHLSKTISRTCLDRRILERAHD